MVLIKEFFKEKKWMKWFQSIPKEWYKPTITVISLLFLFVVFNSKIIEFFNSSIIPILSSVNENVVSSVILLCILFIVSFFWWGKFKGGYYVRPIYILLGLFFSSIYWYYRIFTKDYIIIPSNLFHIGFSDIVFCVLSLWCLVSIITNIKGKLLSKKYLQADGSKGQSTNKAFEIEEDIPITCKDNDLLGYDDVAGSIFQLINQRKNETSFSIGINARWGDGKSSFINLLVKKFEEDNDKFIVIRFNPRYSNNESIQSAFFELLFSKLKEYDSRFKSSFNDYLRVIDVIAENKYLSAIFNTTHLFNREDEKKKINNAIKRLKKRIVVIIEDLDRLMKDEIIEVFKLIDGNAAFDNFIFISAYDKNLINSYLGNQGEVASFSDKFFTMEKMLPLRHWENIVDNLKVNLVKGLNISQEERDDIEKHISVHSNFFKSYLHNLRDVKRYINLIKSPFAAIYPDVQISDYLLIGLIRYRFPHEFRSLYELNIHKTGTFYNNIITIEDNNKKYESQDILSELFPEDGKTSFRSINSIEAFPIYFEDNLFERVGVRKLRSLFDLDSDYRTILKEIFENKHSDDLFKYLDTWNVLSLSGKEMLLRYIDIILHLNASYETFYSTIKGGFLFEKITEEKFNTQYGLSSNEYKNLLERKLKGEYDEYPVELLKQKLWEYKTSELQKELILSSDEILGILKTILSDFIEHEPVFSSSHLDLLQCCISSIDPISRKVTLDHDACQQIRKLIVENPDNFFEKFVRLEMISSSADFNNITCYPFWKQIFENAENLKSLINESRLDSLPKIKLVKNFWDIFENNDYKPIPFDHQGSVQAKIDTNLEDEHKQLQEILDIELNVNTVLISSENIDSKLDSLDTLLKKLESIDLYIKKRGDVITSINNKIEELNKLK